MTSFSEDQTLPLGLENTLNQLDHSKADSLATANDVSTASEVSEYHYPQRSVSPATLSAGTGGKLSPQRSRLMRDQEMQLSELKRDNFGLKLRIYHLEEALGKQLGNDSEDWRLNVDLNVQLGSLKKELQEKSELLLKAKHAMDGMGTQHNGHVNKLTQDFRARLAEEKRRFEEALAAKEREAAALRRKCNHQSESEEQVAVLRGELSKAYAALKGKDEALKELQDREVDPQPLQDELSELKQRLQEAEDSIQPLRMEAESRGQQLEECRRDLARKERELQTLASGRQQSERDAEETAARVQALQGEVERLGEQSRALRRDAGEAPGLRTALRTKDGEIDGLKETLKDLERELGEARKDLSELTDGTRMDRDQLSRELAETAEENEQLRDQVQDLLDRVDGLEQEGVARQEALSRAQQAARDRERRASALDRELAKMAADKAVETAALQRDVEELKEVVHGQEELIKDLNNKMRQEASHPLRRGHVDSHSANLRWPSDQWADGDSGIEELQAEVQGLRKKLKKKDVELTRLKTELEERDGPGGSPPAGVGRRATVGVASQTLPLLQPGQSAADLDPILAELRNLTEQLGNRSQGETTNYFNMSRQPQEQAPQGDVLERLLALLVAQQHPKEPHVSVQPSPVHVNVTVPSGQPSVLTVQPSASSSVLGDLTPPSQRRGEGPGGRGSADLTALRDRVERLACECADKDEAIAALQKALRSIEDKLREREGERARLNDRLVRLKSSSSEQDVEAESLRGAVARLEARLAEQQQELSQAAVETVGRQRQAAAQEQALQALRSTATDQARQLEERRLAGEEQEGRLAEECAEKEAAARALRAELERVRREGGERDRALGQLQAELREKERECEGLAWERDRLKSRASAAPPLSKASPASRRAQPTGPPVLNSSTEEGEDSSDLSGICSQLQELEQNSSFLREKLQEEGQLAEESQIVHVSELGALQSKLAQAQAELAQLRGRSPTPDSRAGTPLGWPRPPAATRSVAVQTGPVRVAHKAVLVRLDSPAPAPAPRGDTTTDGWGAGGLLPQHEGPQYAVQHGRSPPSRPSGDSWSSTEEEGEAPGGGSSSLQPDLSALDDQYQESLRLNRLAQQSIAQQLSSGRLAGQPGRTDKSVGTAAVVPPAASAGKPEATGDAPHPALSALQGQLAGTVQELSSCQNELSSCQKELSSYQKELSSCQNELSSCQNELSSCQKELSSCQNELSSCQRELSLALHQAHVKACEVERLKELQGREAELQELVKKLSKDKGILLKKYRKAKEDLNSLSDQLDTSEAANSGLSGDLASQQKEVDLLRSQLRTQPSVQPAAHFSTGGLSSPAPPPPPPRPSDPSQSWAGRPSDMSFRHPTASSTPFPAPPPAPPPARLLAGRRLGPLPEAETRGPGRGADGPLERVDRGVQHSAPRPQPRPQPPPGRSTGAALDKGPLSSSAHYTTLPGSSTLLADDYIYLGGEPPGLSIYPMSPSGLSQAGAGLDGSSRTSSVSSLDAASTAHQPRPRASLPTEELANSLRSTVDRGTDPAPCQSPRVDKMIQTVQAAKRRLTHILTTPDLKVSDRQFLEELLGCLQQQAWELEEGRRLVGGLTAGAGDSPGPRPPAHREGGRSPGPPEGSSPGPPLAKNPVHDLSRVYQDLLETRSHVLSARDKVRRFTREA